MVKEECGCGGWIRNIDNSATLLVCKNCNTKYILDDGKIKYIDNHEFMRLKSQSKPSL